MPKNTKTKTKAVVVIEDANTPSLSPDKKVGRPLMYKSTEELERGIQEYFNSCFEVYWHDETERDENGRKLYEKSRNGSGMVEKKIATRKLRQIRPITVGGLAMYLGTTRETLREYKERPEFVDTIKRAMGIIEADLEEGMLSGRINPTAGIFNAKNNFGWTDEMFLRTPPGEGGDAKQSVRIDKAIFLFKQGTQQSPTSSQ